MKKIHHMKMAPTSSPSPSKKLLITDPKPKSGPTTAPPNSASSSSTTNAPPPEKRTRDQPNLSDCHCCNRRINHTNPNDRLQPLNSFWRIVLLCRKCRKKVHSGKTCPYCFRETGNPGDLFKCTVCEGKIHKDCVRDYENCRPWFYSGVGLEGFSVCMDCWVPELLKNSITDCGRSENKGGLKGKGGKNLLESVVKIAKPEVEKKVKMVAEAKEQDLRRDIKDKDSPKADDAKLAIQLHRSMNSSPRILRSKSLASSNALDVSNISDWKGLSYKRYALKNQVGVHKLGTCVNSAENEGMTPPGKNDSCSDFSGLNRGLIPYKRDRKRKIWHLHSDSDDPRTRCSMKSGADVSEASISVNAGRNNNFTSVDRFGKEHLYYKRMRSKSKQKVCQVNGLLNVSGGCSSCDNHNIAFKSANCPSDDKKLDRYHWKYVKRVKGTKSEYSFLYSCTLTENQAPPPGLSNFEYRQSDDAKLKTSCLVNRNAEVILPNGSCDAKQDRYHWKYCRRVEGTKSDSSLLHYGTFQNENQASAPGLSDSEYCQSDDANLRKSCLVDSNAEVILPSESCDPEQDRYHWKYGKRATGTKSDSRFLHYGTFRSENSASAPGLRDCLRTSCLINTDAEVILPTGRCDAEKDRYHWKYVKRAACTKSDSSFLHYGTFQSENQATAPCLSDSGYCQFDDANLRTSCLVNSDTEVILPNGSSDADQDRYHWKYVKRVAGTKSDSSFLRYGTLLSDNHACAPGLSESEYCQSDGAKLRTSCLVNSDAEVILPNGSCDAEQDPYHWKYVKRVTGTKLDPRFLHAGTSLSENQASGLALSGCEAGHSAKCDDRYHLKYAKRVKSSKSGSITDTKLHSDTFLNAIEASFPGLALNCSAESRTLTDVSFDSFTNDLPK